MLGIYTMLNIKPIVDTNYKTGCDIIMYMTAQNTIPLNMYLNTLLKSEETPGSAFPITIICHLSAAFCWDTADRFVTSFHIILYTELDFVVSVYSKSI